MTRINENTIIGNTNKTLFDTIEIVESGSNVNGNYIKFNNGTMICYQSITGSANITHGMGSLYRTTTAIELPNFPVSFISPPVVSIMPSAPTDYIFFWGTAQYNEPTINNAGSLWLWRPTSASNVQYRIGVIAIGKWK